VTLSVSVVSTARTLSRPAHNARHQWAERASCIITLRGDDGHLGRGEAAPLPGFSPDNVADGEQALRALDLRDVSANWQPNQDLIGELRRASARIPPNLPAARAALECALLDLWARAARVPAWALLTTNGNEPRARSLSALIMGEPEAALQQALAARDRGLTTFKFKIGRAAKLERELETVRQLRAVLGPGARLRLDANQSLSLSDAKVYLPRFAACQLEFIEEPCAAHAWPELRALGLPLARDESLASGARPEPGDRAAILKPTLIGGISACFALAEAAQAASVPVVFSHAFEGPLGLALCAALALSLGSESHAHGLDLEGARLDAPGLPFFSGSEIHAWSEPGLGVELEGARA